MLRVIISIVFLLTAGLFAVTFVFNDKQKARLENYNALIESGLIEKGWLPDFLPKSIRNVSEEHDLDSNIVSATFIIDIGDMGSFDKACKRAYALDEQIVYECDYQDSELIIKISKDGSGSLIGGPKRSHN